MIEDTFVSTFSDPFLISGSEVSAGTPWDDDEAWVDTDIWED